jgi:hypothetical protein
LQWKPRGAKKKAALALPKLDVMDRDVALDPFHAIGKFLYNKRAENSDEVRHKAAPRAAVHTIVVVFVDTHIAGNAVFGLGVALDACLPQLPKVLTGSQRAVSCAQVTGGGTEQANPQVLEVGGVVDVTEDVDISDPPDSGPTQVSKR